MTFDTLLTASKIIPLLMFFPMFLGILFWAYRRKNRDELESYAHLPLRED